MDDCGENGAPATIRENIMTEVGKINCVVTKLKG
jgi:hypothetical protein